MLQPMLQLMFHIRFINSSFMFHVCEVNNGHSMYWKQGKDFVDGRPWHMLDSVFANDPSDRRSAEIGTVNLGLLAGARFYEVQICSDHASNLDQHEIS